jgi:hypothetical protein
VAGYVVALAISLFTDLVGAPVGAAVGTAVMFAPAFGCPAPPVRRAVRRGLAVGTAAALVFTGFSFVRGSWWGLLLGLVVWQVAVAAALASAVERRVAASVVAEPGVGVVDGGVCPHCRARLPFVRDAFCPECCEPLG